jgi:DNA repair ATPase RecN
MATYAELSERFERRRNAFHARVGEATAVQAELQRVLDEQTAAQLEETTAAQVVELLQSYSEAEQADLQARIEGLVSQGLVAIFGEELGFRMTPGTERGQATLRFTVTGHGAETDVLEARGGGLAAVIGFLLRVIVVVLHPAQPRRFFVLDETFGMVSAGFQEELGRFIRRLCDEADLQVLLVTHAPLVGAAADRVYSVVHDGHSTQIKPMESVEL